MDEVDLSCVVARIAEGYGKFISCDRGWWALIRDLDIELSEIDPLYAIYQVKEKFGGLRFYFAPSDPSRSQKMSAVVKQYESLAAQTCEITGAPGVLMAKTEAGRRLKTLSVEFANQGWEIVDYSQPGNHF